MVFDRSTRLFLRYRDRGDTAALAAVFDRTAPELLRRSPGTVRGQLHRGIEQLRGSMPTAIATTLLAMAITPARGRANRGAPRKRAQLRPKVGAPPIKQDVVISADQAEVHHEFALR